MKEIIDYYEICEGDYKTFWDLDYSKAMHAGYWDATTKTLRQALKRENEILFEIAAIQPGERVLDAGCGVGGSSLFLAEKGCSVDGITLVPYQVERARENAEEAQVNRPPRFHVMDYTQTDFANNTFDVVWAIESVCHAADKEAFVKEAYRILKPGGRLIVADGFMLEEGVEMDKWLRGWALPDLATPAGFQLNLKNQGFKIEKALDATTNVMPSSRRLYRIAKGTIWLSKLAERFGWRTPQQTANLEAAYWHHKTLEKGMWKYYIMLSVK